MEDVKKARVEWIDNVRLFAMVWVVAGHCQMLIHRTAPEWINLLLLAFNMALFVMLSGYCFRAKTENFLKFVLGMADRLLVPAVFFVCINRMLFNTARYVFHGSCDIMDIAKFAVVSLFFAGAYLAKNRIPKAKYLASIAALGLSFIVGDLWFLIMLFWVMVISGGVISLLKTRNLVIQAIVAFMVSVPLSMYVYDQTSEFILYFFVGYALKQYGVLDKKLANNCVSPVCLLCIGVALLAYGGRYMVNYWQYHFMDYVHAGDIHVFFLRHLCAISIGLSFILLIKRINDKVSFGNLCYWGSMTLPLYAVHAGLSIWIKSLDIQLDLTDTQYYIYLIPATALWLVVSALIIKGLNRYKFCRIMMFGSKK